MAGSSEETTTRKGESILVGNPVRLHHDSYTSKPPNECSDIHTCEAVSAYWGDHAFDSVSTVYCRSSILSFLEALCWLMRPIRVTPKADHDRRQP